MAFFSPVCFSTRDEIIIVITCVVTVVVDLGVVLLPVIFVLARLADKDSIKKRIMACRHEYAQTREVQSLKLLCKNDKT